MSALCCRAADCAQEPAAYARLRSTATKTLRELSHRLQQAWCAAAALSYICETLCWAVFPLACCGRDIVHMRKCAWHTFEHLQACPLSYPATITFILLAQLCRSSAPAATGSLDAASDILDCAISLYDRYAATQLCIPGLHQDKTTQWLKRKLHMWP